MTLTFKEVDQILRIIEEFPADEVRFEYGDLKLYVRRDGARIVNADATPPLPTVATASTAVSVVATAIPPVAQATPEKRLTATPIGREGLVPVTAPMLGVFYGSPAPDAPPFVTVGQMVSESTDLCIIETMKVMNNIKSPCAGRVVEVVAENGAMVERAAAIFWIEPMKVEA